MPTLQYSPAELASLAEQLQPYLVTGAPSLLDSKEAAARLNVSESTLRRLVNGGQLARVPNLSKWLFRDEELTRFTEAAQ